MLTRNENMIATFKGEMPIFKFNGKGNEKREDR